MKVFCFIFIVYFVQLLTQPCQDLAAINEDCGNSEAQIAHVDKTSQGDSQRDECLPFCICSCCSHPVANHKFSFGITSEVEYIAIAATLIEYTNPYNKAHQNSIWQPPKA